MPLTRRAVLGGLAATPFIPKLAAARDASRIVSIGGSMTETVFYLGEADRLIGTDTTSRFPAEANALPKVGYMRNLSVEGVLSLDPTLLLAVEGSGPPDALASFRTARLDVAMIPEARDIPGVLEKVRQVADIVENPQSGRRLAAEISKRADRVSQAISRLSSKPKVLFLLDIREGALMAAGRETAAEAIVSQSGGELVFDEFSGYKPISTESALAADCDFILMMEQSVERLGGPDAVANLGPLRPLRAARENRILSMDGLLLLGFGPRTPDAMIDLARRMHGHDSISEDLPPLTPA